MGLRVFGLLGRGRVQTLWTSSGIKKWNVVGAWDTPRQNGGGEGVRGGEGWFWGEWGKTLLFRVRLISGGKRTRTGSPEDPVKERPPSISINVTPAPMKSMLTLKSLGYPAQMCPESARDLPETC